MKILINTVNLTENERVYPGYEMPEDCVGAKLIVSLSKNGKNREKLKESMYVVWLNISEVEGIIDCEWWEYEDQAMMVVFRRNFNWLGMAKAIKDNLSQYRKTKHLVLEFQFDDLMSLQINNYKSFVERRGDAGLYFAPLAA